MEAEDGLSCTVTSVYIATHIHINQAVTVMKVKRTEGRPLVFSSDVSVINYDGVPVNIQKHHTGGCVGFQVKQAIYNMLISEL